MYKQLQIIQTLVYYDVPNVFIGKDIIGTRYLCLLIDDINLEYISTPISSEKVNMLLNSQIDLRIAFQAPELNLWYKSVEFENNLILMEEADFGILPEDYLPLEGFFLPPIESSDEYIIADVLRKENTVVHLSLSDSKNHKNIEAEILGDFLKLYQALVKYAFKNTMIASKQKKQNDNANNYTLHAFAASPGSFSIHLESYSYKNLFGSSIIEDALTKIDEIAYDFDNESSLIEVLQSAKGHTMNTYKKLLEKIIKYDIKFVQKWFSPGVPEVRKTKIDKKYAEWVYQILSSKEELSKEIKEFIGLVKQADVEKGNWRIHNIEDEKDYSGYSDGHVLDGIVLETMLYKFVCEEIIEEEKVMEKEKVKYKLTELIKLK